jgi:polar amino acid transport system substrate-binding protein
MIPGVQARRFDMIAAGLFIKPKRCMAILFSEPDLCDGAGFAVKKGNPLGLMTYGDVANHATAKIGGPGGGSEVQLAIDAGVPQSRIIIVPDGQSGIKMLMDGRLDVYALPTLSIADLLDKADSTEIEMVGPVEDAPVLCAGVGFHKDDRALRDAYDIELAALKESGEFAEIVSSFGFPAEAAFMTTRDQLCGESEN